MQRKSDYRVTELRFQQDCYLAFTRKYPREIGRLFMIYNNPKNDIEGAKLIGAGMLSGLPDFGFLLANSIAFFELKHGSVQMETQKWFESICRYFGIEYYLIDTLEDFLAKVEEIRGGDWVQLPEMPLSKWQKQKYKARNISYDENTKMWSGRFEQGKGGISEIHSVSPDDFNPEF